MRSIFILSITFILSLSCATLKDAPAPEETLPAAARKDDRETTITVDNPTVYNVYIEGAIEKRIEKKSSNNKIPLLIEDGPLSGGFNIFYEIPLSNSVIMYYRGDHRTFRENQRLFTIEEPHHIENYGTFITLRNKANNAVRFLTGRTPNHSWVQTGSSKTSNNVTRSDKYEFSPNEMVVFKIDYDSRHDNYFIQDGRNNIPLILPENVKNNYVYTFEYSANNVTLTDFRPLSRIGEEPWLEPIDVAGTEPIQVVVAEDNKEIHVFASTDRGLVRNAYNSAGNVINSSPPREGIPYLSFAGLAESGFFVAGYEKRANRDYLPIARILNADGATRCPLEHSGKYSARIFTAAKKDNTTWLLAGEGKRIGAEDHTAYASLVRLEKNVLKPVWERGGDDFKGNSAMIECGEIESAVYDHVKDRWLVTGKNINQNGSFVAVISGNGSITIDPSFKDTSFHKMVIDSSGICYLAGDEQRGNETYAVLVKYNINDKRSEKISTQPPSHSYYQDVLIDTAYNRIVLAGVLRAEDETGNGGVPFVEIIDIRTGKSSREELSGPEMRGAALVTSIVPAPDYGFALALSGIVDSYYGKPFLIARVNSQGKYMRRIGL